MYLKCSSQEGGGMTRKGRASSMSKDKRTICVCGASSYYERERFSLMKEKSKHREDVGALKEKEKRLSEEEKILAERLADIEKKADDLERRERALATEEHQITQEKEFIDHANRTLSKQVCVPLIASQRALYAEKFASPRNTRHWANGKTASGTRSPSGRICKRNNLSCAHTLSSSRM